MKHIQMFTLIIIILAYSEFLSQLSSSAQTEPEKVQAIAWSPDGTKIAAAIGSQGIQVYDANLNAILALDFPGPKDLKWSPNSQQLAFFYSDYDETARAPFSALQIWDVAMDSPVLSNPVRFIASGTFSWSPDGTRLAVPDPIINHDENGMYIVEENATIIDASTGTILLDLPLSTDIFDDVGVLAWSPDAQFIAGTAGSEEVVIWNANTGVVAKILQLQPDDRASRLAWSPNSEFLAHGSRQGIVIWDIIAETVVHTLPQVRGGGFGLSWQDNIIISLDFDDNTGKQLLEAWDTSTGEAIYSETFDSPFYSIDLSPDGQIVAVGGTTTRPVEIIPLTTSSPNCTFNPTTAIELITDLESANNTPETDTSCLPDSAQPTPSLLPTPP